MEVKTYRAKNIQEAFQLIRQDIGPQAVILHSREVQTTRLFGLIRGKKEVEVTASKDINIPSRFSSFLTGQAESLNSDTALLSVSGTSSFENTPLKNADVQLGTSHSTFATEDKSQSFSHSWQVSDLDMRSLWCAGTSADTRCTHFEHTSQETREENIIFPKKSADDLSKMTISPSFSSKISPASKFNILREDEKLQDYFLTIYAELINADLDDIIAHNLLEKLRNHVGTENTESITLDFLRKKLMELVQSSLRTCGPIQITPGKCRLVALVGPTGVGKTTTIAKLAAHYKFHEHCNVGLITLDTFRIAAVEQLKTYADIISSPMEVVSSTREIKEAVRRMTDFDIILMDTAGRSQNDDLRIHELRSYLLEAGADEVHLVLSGTSRPRVLQQIFSQFSVVGPTAMIITKLDESAGLGNLLSLTKNVELPVSYITNGQNVPEDFEVATPRQLARWILGMEALTTSKSSRELQMRHDGWE
ncbi:MAG: flagellar biosynthesis protein FlhF [Planctomycetia bacterium]|nr:flagellar biosynthesis protein FlhF [Planctomycetia bacterium]